MSDSPRPTIQPDPLANITPPVAVEDRVTVRYRLDDGSATDVVGWITELDNAQVQVLASRSGQPTRVSRARIIIAKRVPPAMGGPAPARTSAAELEQIATYGWVADSESLGEWTIRTGDGFTARANSCLAVGDPGVSMPAAAEIVCTHYTSRDLEPLMHVIADSSQDQHLSALGWRETRESATVLAIPLTRLLDRHPRHPGVTISDQLSDRWWRAFQQYRSAPDAARRILTGIAPVGFAQIAADDSTEDTDVLAIGRGQVNSGWLGLTALWTSPAHRRRGLATMIMQELGHWAARRQARNVYLQVSRTNQSAIAAYQQMGFAIHHDYRYLAPPADRH